MSRPASDISVAIEDIPTAEIAAEHYQKTYELVYDFWRERNKSFLLLLVVAGVESLLLIQPEGVLAVSCYVYQKYLFANADCTEQGLTRFVREFPFGLLQSSLLIVILYLMMQIYHRTVFINNMYKYVGKLEDEIRWLGGFTGRTPTVFTREGRFYNENQELLQKVTGLTYTLLLGAILLLVFCGWASSEGGGADSSQRFLTVIDTLSLAVIAVFYGAYLWPVLKKNKEHLGRSRVGRLVSRRGTRGEFRRRLWTVGTTGVLFSLLMLVADYYFDHGWVRPGIMAERIPGTLARALFYLGLYVLLAVAWASKFSRATLAPEQEEGTQVDDGAAVSG